MLLTDMRFHGFRLCMRVLTARDTATPDFLTIPLFVLNHKEEAFDRHGVARCHSKKGQMKRRAPLLIAHAKSKRNCVLGGGGISPPPPPRSYNHAFSSHWFSIQRIP